MSSVMTSSIESIPLPPAAPQIRRPVKEAKGSGPAGQKTSIVTRQMSPKLALPAIIVPAFQSVSDFVDAYEATDKTIFELTGKFVYAADEAKQKQDDIVPHFAYMQSLLSKKGSNHQFVIEARKNGDEIPWWTEYYETYKDQLWKSLRTMERRIDAYRKDPSVPTPKPRRKPKQLTQLEHKLLGTATCVHEALTDLDAGHIDDAVKKLKEDLPTQDRIDEYLQRGVKPTLAKPDGGAKPDNSQLQTGSTVEPSPALSVRPTVTYEDWTNHHLPAPDYKLKCFDEASEEFKDGYHCALQGVAFTKILNMLKDKPGQVLSNAHDFGQMAVVLQSASENLKLLAAAITTRLAASPASSSERGGNKKERAPYLALTGKPFDDGKEIVEAIFLLTADEKHQFVEGVRIIGPDQATRVVFEAVLRHAEFMGQGTAETAKPLGEGKERVEAAFVLMADEKQRFMETVDNIGPAQATRVMFEAVLQHVELMREDKAEIANIPADRVEKEAVKGTEEPDAKN
jgi:hypothetical protein